MKNQTNWRVIFAIIIGIIMVGSTIGFIIGFSGSGVGGESIRVNGFRLTVTPTGYETKINGQTIKFTYPPDAANGTYISPEAISQIKNAAVVYLTSDPNSTSVQDIALVQFQLQEILANSFKVQSQIAFTQPYLQSNIITCANASPQVQVIVFEDDNSTSANYGNNCLELKAVNSNAYAELRDRLVYGLFGIIR